MRHPHIVIQGSRWAEKLKADPPRVSLPESPRIPSVVSARVRIVVAPIKLEPLGARRTRDGSTRTRIQELCGRAVSAAGERGVGREGQCLADVFLGPIDQFRVAALPAFQPGGYAMDQTLPRYQVICEIDGKTHRGTYWIAGKILTVSTGMGGKSRQVGSTPAEILAQELLRDLAKEGKT